MRRSSHRHRSRPFRWLLLLIPALGAFAAISIPRAQKRDYAHVSVNGQEAHVVTIDPRVSEVDVYPVLVPRAEFEQVVGERKPRAAINGTYFDRKYGPMGDVVAQGKILARGRQRSAIAVDSSGSLRFRRRVGRGPFDWKGFSAGLACGPMLVRGGKSTGFGPFSRTLRAARSAVGLTADGKLLLVVIPGQVTLDETARIMLKLGAVDAMNLDGGASCALYSQQTLIVKPYSSMSTVLLVTDRR